MIIIIIIIINDNNNIIITTVKALHKRMQIPNMTVDNNNIRVE